MRSFFFFGVTGYAYFFREGARRGKMTGGAGAGAGGGADAAGGSDGLGPGANLKNSLVFTLGFLETVLWYWVGLFLHVFATSQLPV